MAVEIARAAVVIVVEGVGAAEDVVAGVVVAAATARAPESFTFTFTTRP
jgi:hypothetical protein